MKITTATAALLLLNVWLSSVGGFSPVVTGSRSIVVPTIQVFSTTVTSEDSETETTSRGLFKRDRYVATNRFSVRKGKQAKFEKRWATRKSSLAKLDGFKYFHLMRRVSLNNDNTNSYDEGETNEELFENYVSFTVWSKKSQFSAWRTGEAFREAHGGTSIGAFLSTMVSSAMVLKGAPRPAFYDGLFLQSNKPTIIPVTVDGWRSVNADGINTLPPECFVSFEKYYIPASNAKEFEEFWAKNKPDMMDAGPSFVSGSLMRRDGQAKGHGIVEMQSSEPSYVVVNIFEDRSAYQAWAQTEQSPFTGSLSQRAPETVFYEGTLVISSQDGA
eukprot:CAMPEP_0198137306 /NCGR_PEP_ID=MMETSP1443-20131203/828_1 /TAXON_ID=186043 /ORGANISM="Entomoneis sp., Strain CCMP2396" /LENGTH=329 /DNA_ID=CAMNT_0043798703 /DNA_START=56 /DNA_END=1045 /DNA_ORIENTATION=+